MRPLLGNSGAPRWYDLDSNRFREYLDHVVESGASSAEIVLHDGDADEFTSRVHVVRSDWESITKGYRDRRLTLSVHGPLTPEFSPKRWKDDQDSTLARYLPILQQVADIAEDQGGATLILHALADNSGTQCENEHMTAAFLTSIADQLERYSSLVSIAIELRAFRQSRSTAAATTRESVLRVLNHVNHPRVGICWDVAHDLESHIALGQEWSVPDPLFLNRVRHVHLHDLGPEYEPHYPPLIGTVPLDSSIDHLTDIPIVMEVRWRMAERMGNPWDILARSYEEIQTRTRS